MTVKPVRSTGAEPWCLGWQIARLARGRQTDAVLGGDALRGFAACEVARATGGKLDDDAALAAWMKVPT